MVDVEKLIELADEHITDILTALCLEWREENGWIVLQCIFHGGDGWNLKYRDKSFYCFSQCQRGYSIINLIQKVLELDFLDATRWLCNELGIDNTGVAIDKQKIEIRNRLKRLKGMKSKKRQLEYQPVNQDVLDTIETCIPQYLLDQGFSKETIKHFDIGYARIGVLVNRVCFPIDAPDGTIISVSGRLPNAGELGLPKYKIVQGTDKSHTLYNISRVDPQDSYVIVVEGFKAVMSLYEYGFKSCVALMGASLGEIQRNLLLRMGRKIIVIGDNDEAGRRMAQSVYNQCSRFAEVVKVDLGQFTDVDKASPCEIDMGYSSMCDLVERIEEVIKCG